MAFALALHTTTADLGMAIARVDKLNQPYLHHIKEQSWNLGRELSTQAHFCMNDFIAHLSWSDLVFIAVARGVGSFTGTRIGIVLARTLGEQLSVPVYAINCEKIVKHTQQAQTPLALSQGLLEIAHMQWKQGIYPQWFEALPEYSSN